jgi:hypothetical protein
MRTLKGTTYSYLEKRKTQGKKRGYIAIGVGFTLLALGFSLTNLWLIILGFLAFAFGSRYVYYYYTAEAGIKGEKAVTEALRGLDDSYFLINDLLLPRRGGNIDHILLSPKGVFCIETKNWSGDIRCYRDEWSKKGRIRIYPVESVSKQAWKNANDLSDLIRRRLNIGVSVTPICVFTDASAKLKLTRPTLAVVRLAELTHYIRDAKPLTNLTEDGILSIAQSILPKRLAESVIRKERGVF